MNRAVNPQQTNTQTAELINEIIRLSDFTFDRLPMLDILGERLAANIAHALPAMTGVLCEASLAQVEYQPMAQVLDSLPAPSLLAICGGPPFMGQFLLSIDAPFLITAMELALGGEAKGIGDRETDGFTEIECGFGRQLARLTLEEMQQSLLVITESDLDLESIEPDVETVNITQPANLCARMRISVALAGQAGTVEIVIPYNALEPIKPKLGTIHFGDPTEKGNAWHDQLMSQIHQSKLELEAVYGNCMLSLREIMGWRPGQSVELGLTEGQMVTLTCADTPLFRATVGRRNNGKVAVQVTETLELRKDVKNGGDVY